ncbi:MAG: 23S rRNA (adenine(2503)-C(2))-methyltransferase RlmN [Spirochaetaceae bacterium]|jgi:23S rRNA (adenine2503-C2)-methyltransferase|nr:23S rRNA (adenine(2503)-C(2))-methyltransferase RlmN [Spirochaetaceae bacterium]
MNAVTNNVRRSPPAKLPADSAARRPPLSGVPLDELVSLLAPIPAFRVKQIFLWLRRGAASFFEMTDIPLAAREELNVRWALRSTNLAGVKAGDSAQKAQILLEDGVIIEAVLLIDGAGRKTACLSTQAGCPVRCVFCKTGGLGFKRSLNSSEIVEQYYHLKHLSGGEISNIVFMGMGEPLLNLDELRRAVLVLSHGFSLRRITVSTCGIIEGIYELAAGWPAVRLAVSVPSARQQLRNRLMPGCAGHTLEQLKAALYKYQAECKHRITLETVLLGGVNTSEQDAGALAEFAGGLSVMVNLIPWNPAGGLLFEGQPLSSPGRSEVARFRQFLEARGIKAELRRRKGTAISGACGQLGVLPDGY